jgi:predicted negative regulator of RcsB-dependent stress response
MTTSPSADNQPQVQPATVIEPGFEVTAQAFWDKNRRLIMVVCAAGLLAVIGREGWQYFAAQHEQGVRNDYAKAADRPEQLAAFAAANTGHALAGVAYLRLADTKYSAAEFRPAAENYTKAAANLKNPALLGRAKIGAAMSQINNGDKVAGDAALKALGADATLLKDVRAEANYHLATLAYDAGNASEVSRLVTEIGKIDPASVWSQRATTLLTISPNH